MFENLENVEVWITGTQPLLMARFGEEAEASVPGGSSKGTRPVIPTLAWAAPLGNVRRCWPTGTAKVCASPAPPLLACSARRAATTR